MHLGFLSNLPISLQLYLVCYFALSLVCICLLVWRRNSYNFLTLSYFKFLFTKQRLLIYILGTLALVIPVPIIDYHSWDYPIAICQPILAFLMAPWAVEVFCKFEKKKAKYHETFCAFCMMMFTGSWSVELYLLWRDGFYMPDWLINIPIGIACFLIIGTLLNIDWGEKEH